jgi:DNA processing protein
MDATLAYLTLTHTKGLGPRKIKMLVDSLGSAKAVLEASDLELSTIDGIGPAIVQAIQEAKQKPWARQEFTKAENLGVQIIHLEHPDYPELLRHIYDPPSVLYVRGNLPAAHKSIGIVGTREATPYAMSFTHQLAKALVQANITVISGLAIGIDTAAHQGAVNNNGQTIAVLGSGVDVIYPRQNLKLSEQILNGHGAIISEYPLGTQPSPTHFPGRNRIINGLSQGVVVVEAGEKSGALITSDYALEEGRTVFAVPGRVGDAKAKGTLNLIKQGAVLLESAQDIFNEFSWTNTPSQSVALELSENEKLILKSIQTHDSALLDDIQTATQLTISELTSTLMMLELKGIVKHAGGRYFALTKV